MGGKNGLSPLPGQQRPQRVRAGHGLKYCFSLLEFGVWTSLTQVPAEAGFAFLGPDNPEARGDGVTLEERE